MDLAGGVSWLECCQLTVQIIWGPEGQAWGPGHIHCLFCLYLFLSYITKESEINMNSPVLLRPFPGLVCVSLEHGFLPPFIRQARTQLILPAEASEWVFK